jgi:hypothetical protein
MRSIMGLNERKYEDTGKIHIYELHVLCSSTDIIREIQ